MNSRRNSADGIRGSAQRRDPTRESKQGSGGCSADDALSLFAHSGHFCNKLLAGLTIALTTTGLV
jgi:hypothetical protein